LVPNLSNPKDLFSLVRTEPASRLGNAEVGAELAFAA
jgi:hypothetical protein